MSSVKISLAPGIGLQGQTLYARGSERAVQAFRGIPYAKPPTGNLRFRPPQPGPLWSGYRDATKFGKN